MDDILTEPAAIDIVTTPGLCAGDDIDLSTTAVATSYEWLKNGSVVRTTTGAGAEATTFTTADPEYGTGDWSVRTTDANGCMATSSTATVTVNEVPTALPTNGGDVVIGNDVQLSASATPIGTATYRWYDGDPNTTGTLVSLSQNPTLVGLAAGTYTYFVTVEINGCLSAAASTSFEVFDEPTVNPTPGYTVAPDCSAADLTLTANAAAGTAPYTFSWTGPNGFASTATNPVIVGADETDNGSYTVTITDQNGATATASTNVNNIPAGPQQPAISVSDATACSGDEILLSGTSYAGSSVTYTWEYDADGFGAGAAATTTVTASTGQGTSQLSLKPATAANHDGEY
ncbi:MAG: hypothetical protein AB8F78_07590 [Saprospiraceae bacterium]